MKLKVIRIYPSVWDLDVIVGGTQKELEEISKKRYGLTYNFLQHNECTSIDSAINSELKGRRGVVVTIKNTTDKLTIVHEIVHAIWHIADYIGYKITYDTQEWQAILFEYIFDEITKKEGYQDYKTKSTK